MTMVEFPIETVEADPCRRRLERLQNLHPRFKFGRRLQIHILYF